MTKVKLSDLDLAPVAIEYLREIKGWSYADIAKRLKCNKSTIYRAHAQGASLMRHNHTALKRLVRRVWREENGAG